MDRAGFERLLAVLAAQGYELIGPTVRDGAIVLDRIEGAEDLPRGVRETQGPGTYRLEQTGDDRLFAWAHGPDAAKRFLFPPRETIQTAHRDTDGAVTVTPAPVPDVRYAFIGLRSCDLHAIEIQDRVFLAADPAYRARRQQAIFVGVHCGSPGATCFCTSMQTGPRCTTGFDIALTELDDGFTAEAGTPAGEALLFEVGAIIESPSFYPYLSGRENLRALAGSGAPVAGRRIEELLELVGLRDRAGDKVSRYSLGMKQRLGIAGAMLNDPRLLLLDEPGNGLDPAGIAALRDTLRFLAAEGKTVFVSSHLLSEVQQLADLAGIIAKGRLVREGSIASLLATGGLVRVRVGAVEVPRATEVLAALVGASVVRVREADAGTLEVAIDAGRSAEVNRALAEAGIFAAAIEAGSDLESIFLELTDHGAGSSENGVRSLGAAG